MDRELAAIHDGYIFCPGYSTLNDPMEGKHERSLGLILQGRTNERLGEIERIQSSLGVASMSEVDDHDLCGPITRSNSVVCA